MLPLPPNASTTIHSSFTTHRSDALKALDAQLGGALSDIVTRYEFKGKAVRGCWPAAVPGSPAVRILPCLLLQQLLQ